VTLRQLTSGDAEDLFAVFSDPQVMRYWSHGPLQQLEEARRLVERINEGRREGTLLQWGVIVEGTDRVVGTTTLFRISRDHRRAEIGFALGSAWWGRGLAKAAVERLLAWSFDTLDLYRLEADVDPRNESSLRLLEVLGFRREGLLRARYHVAGEVQDSVLLGLLRNDWQSRMALRRAGH
jgi:RimJ/RimL family protein N-acetyltransferase